VRSGAALLGIWLALGCASTPAFELPEERTSGRPLEQAPNPRSGEISWRAGPISSTPDGVRVEFTLMNGTPRHYAYLMLRLVLRGSGREIATVRYPTGPLAAYSSREVHAHLAWPGFAVEGTQLELIWARE
jgi:hypothetical protein